MRCEEYAIFHVKGEKGPKGSIGPQGDIGNIGIHGCRGEIGWEGKEGPEGPRGIIGETGDVGLTGEQGHRGKTGEKVKGPQGCSGEYGLIGLRGPTPPTKTVIGCTGPQGCPGEQGHIGYRGPSFPSFIGSCPIFVNYAVTIPIVSCGPSPFIGLSCRKIVIEGNPLYIDIDGNSLSLFLDDITCTMRLIVGTRIILILNGKIIMNASISDVGFIYGAKMTYDPLASTYTSINGLPTLTGDAVYFFCGQEDIVCDINMCECIDWFITLTLYTNGTRVCCP